MNQEKAIWILDSARDIWDFKVTRKTPPLSHSISMINNLSAAQIETAMETIEALNHDAKPINRQIKINLVLTSGQITEIKAFAKFLNQ